MNYKIGEIRKKIRALRSSMLAAEDVVRGQISRDEDCSIVASQILTMRTEMNRLLRERMILGDREPIAANFAPRQPAFQAAIARPIKRRLKRVG